MSFLLKSAALAAAFICISSGISLAQVSPDMARLLTIAATKDGGKNLGLVMDMVIAANPDKEADIRAHVAGLKPAAPAEAAPAPAAPVETIEENPGFFTFAGWDGEVELNFLRTSGNTSQESLGLGGKMKRETDQFHHEVAAFFDLNKNTGIKDKQKWGLSYKLDYDFSEKLYLTGFAGYENDQFGAFRERITTSLGLGYPVITTDSYSWKLEGGPSILFTRALPGDSYESSFNGFANSIFVWTINERSEFTNNSVAFFGNRAVIESKSALKVKINGALSSKFSYDILYDRDAPVGRNKTDTVARAGLLYDF